MWKKLKDNLSTIGILVGLLSTLSGGYVYIDTRYALASDHRKTEELLAQTNKKLNLFELKLLYQSALDNLYYFRKKAREYPDDTDIKQKLEEAQRQLDNVDAQIQALSRG